MESNWRYWVFESGLTPWAFDPSGGGGQRWLYIARLIVPFYIGDTLIEAVGKIQLEGTTQIVAIALFEGTYPVQFYGSGIPDDVPFPGPFEVWADSPAVPWD